MNTLANEFFAIEDVLQSQREQRESVKGKPTPFRVEFRFGQGHSSYQYFETYEDASKAECRSCDYSPFGRAIIRRPSSQHIQVKGPRGGWKRFTGGTQ